MNSAQKSLTFVLPFLVIALLSGCTNWKKKYMNLKAKHNNLQGQYDLLQSKKGELSEELTKSQQTINELRNKIEKLEQSPAQATGFEGMDVKFDASKGTITVTLEDKILFSPGKAKLKKSSIKELDKILSVLKSKYSGKKIDIVGHTDSDPIKKSGWDDNWELSAQRALSVLRYLVDRGIPDDQVRAIGCGKARPVASNATSAGKAKNRRVEIVVHIK